MKTLIIYSGHQINDNFLYFCRNGYINSPLYDFVFVFNDPNLKLKILPNKTNIKIMTRENTGLDFGGWTFALLTKENDQYLYEKYDYFVFINSTVRGPFLPSYYDQNKHGYWPEFFISKLSDQIKLVGSVVAFYLKRPFISSAFFVTDRIGLDIGMKNGVFDIKTINYDKRNVVIRKEIGFSNLIMDAGYNISSMLTSYKNTDLKNTQFQWLSLCHLNPKKYYDIDINPYEIIFIKQNRNIEPLVLERYTEWNNKKLSNIKLLYGISLEQSIDVTTRLIPHISKNGFIPTNFNINKYAGDPYPNTPKKLFVVHNESTDYVEEFSSYLITNVIII